ncbi:MAG: hypothetical protein K6G17_01035 [Oscillospiraceae bacterium]|nr:hypothetical protein [Oscillospiraceae bacterium]
MIAVAILVGAAVGLLTGLLGGALTRRALKSGRSEAVTAASFGRTLLDLGVLTLIFLLRGRLPFDWTVTLIAAAVSLSLCTIAVSFLLAKDMKGKGNGGDP